MKLENVLFIIMIGLLVTNIFLLQFPKQNIYNTEYINSSFDNINKMYNFYNKRIPRNCTNQSIRSHIGLGTSMDPMFVNDERYNYDIINFSDIKAGDIILFKINDTRILHAVKGVYYDYVVTQGYNNPTKDRYIIKEENLIGRYCVK